MPGDDSLAKYTWQVGEIKVSDDDPDNPPHLPKAECEWIFHEIQRRNKLRKSWSESELEDEYDRLHAEGEA